MPKQLEDCVKSIKGTNKKTGKPYTQSEKYAICNSQLQKHGKSSFEDEIVLDDDVFEYVESSMEECKKREMMKGKSKEDAEAVCNRKLSKSGYDVSRLWFVYNEDLI